MKKDCEIFNGSKRNDIDLLGLNIFLHFFVLIQKNEAKKNQDCARFARKISARTAKSSKLATSLLKQWTIFNAVLTYFSAHRSRSVAPPKVYERTQRLFLFLRQPSMATNFLNIYLNFYVIVIKPCKTEKNFRVFKLKHVYFGRCRKIYLNEF